MITYKVGMKGLTVYHVYLDGKHVGDIRAHKPSGQFYYKPKGGGRGDLMGTVREVQKSLEGK